MYLTIPNLLTLMRIMLVPVFAISVWYGYMAVACVLFAIAGLTDLLDGFIARRLNQSSSLGAFLDPMADKLLMTVAFLLLSMRGAHLAIAIPIWVAILAISRDVIISLFALSAPSGTDPSRLKPSMLGKVTTGVELVVISLALLSNAIAPAELLNIFFPWSFYLVACFVMASGLHYFFRAASVPKSDARR